MHQSSEHTPGPWEYGDDCIVEADGTTVAHISVLFSSTAHAHLKANLRLMSAAPELLAALKALLDDQRDASLPILTQARAAIRRAT